MCTTTDPPSAAETLDKLQTLVGHLADVDAASLPAAALAELLQGMEQADAVWAVVWARYLAAFDAKDGHLADGQRNLPAWLVHMLRVTRAQAVRYKTLRALPRDHEPLLAGLRAKAVTKSVALQLAQWTQAIPGEFRGQAEEILVAASRAGASLRALAEICAEILSRTAPPDPDGRDPALDRALVLDTTLDGAGVLRGDSRRSVRRWCWRSWTPWPPRPGPGTCGPGRSATTTRWPRRCAACWPPTCCRSGPGSPLKRSCT